jgi:hypothetical protein
MMVALKAKSRARLALVLLTALTPSLSCNSRDSVLDTSGAPGGPTPVIPGVTIGFDPPGVMGGNDSRGTVTLRRPAPDGGTLVGLQSGHGAVAVPSSVTVPAGSQTTTFLVRTTSVPRDTAAPLSASASGAVATGSLAVWAVLPTYFSAVSEDGGFIGRSGYRRFTPDVATFTANCSLSEVTIRVNADLEFWSANFGAPRGTPLRPGTYERATRTAFRDATSPGIDVSGTGGCNQTNGRFVVHEVSLTPTGGVQRFWATFEQYCDQNPAALRGEVRATGVPPAGTAISSCLR